jgi:hypothetical protein
MTDITANDPIDDPTTDDPPDEKPPAVASKMVFVLSLAGLLSGLLIVLVYEFTLPMIEANRARAGREAGGGTRRLRRPRDLRRLQR